MNLRPLLSFLILQGICWCLLSIAYFATNGFFTDPLGILFSVSFLIGHIFLFAWMLGLIIFPFNCFQPKLGQLLCILLGSALSSAFLIDLIVFSQYRFHIGPAMLDLFFGPAGNEIFVFPTSLWVLCGIILLVIISVETGLVYLARKWKPRKYWIFFIFLGWLVCFLAYNGLHAWGKFKMLPSIVGQRNALPLAYPLSANRRLEKWGFTPQQNPLGIPRKGILHYPKHPLVCTPKQNAQNILFIVIDSWREDTITPEVMPRLSKWVQIPGMTLFANHLSGGNSTAGGIFSLFYSMPQSYWDDVTSRQIPPVLVSQLLSQGYIPAIFASSKLNSPAFNRNIFLPIANLRIGSDGKTSWQRDTNAVNDFLQFLQEPLDAQPFFGFIFLDAPHGYSYPPSSRQFEPAEELNYLLLNNTTDPTPYLNQYKNAVYFADQLIDRVLQALQQGGFLKNTWVIITGDHGQELNDSRHNFWGHNGNFTDYQTKVPLLVYSPTGKPAQTITYRTSHYDLVPTLLQRLFQCTNPTSDYSIGQDLWTDELRPFTVFSGHTEKAVRVDDTILVFDLFGGIKQYNNRLEPITLPADQARVKAGLKSFSHFYKKDKSGK